MPKNHDDMWLDPDTLPSDLMEQMKEICSECGKGDIPSWWVDKPEAYNKAWVNVVHGPGISENTCGGQILVKKWYWEKRGWPNA